MNHIVLVEDDPDDVYFFRQVIKKSDIELRLTNLSDGIELLEFLNRKQDEQFLIFLDLNMPRMSGLEVLAHLKEKELINKHIVIAYTTSDYNKDIEDAYDLGVKSYIVKPSNQAELSSLIQSALDYWFNWNKLPEPINGI
ncbi:response regulator [Psychrosphaera ytuae]|uniref:Response regulator n=1 Tax=Psychrosphaera ytuae TaxID=2820710 RepID=A0A975DAI5_9GAMM|nr:response regulator [Psychrosphaera ytuae]QTH63561.1 response regulator [Psychrosphaera ytuae]